MLIRLAAAAAAAALALTAAPSASTAAGGQDFPGTVYDQCMFNAYYGCYPRDEYGNIRPPNLGNIDEAAAFEACLVTAYAACSGLPGDPG